MKILDYNAAHTFVETTPNTFWENYDIVVFKPTPSCLFRKDARFIDGKWGIAKRYPVGSDGNWRVGSR